MQTFNYHKVLNKELVEETEFWRSADTKEMYLFNAS
jgi:hypothetical protein